MNRKLFFGLVLFIAMFIYAVVSSGYSVCVALVLLAAIMLVMGALFGAILLIAKR